MRNSECDFHMNAAGSHGGPLGELNGGQIRCGNIPQTTFHIDGDKIWDRNGHGCWWTPCPPPAPAPPQPAKSCPANLNGVYEFPHLIVSVDKSNPDKAAGTSFFGEVTSSISSIFNFDIPAADAGKTCTLVFLFPRQDELTTSSFTFSGDGKIDFSLLNSPATQGTTWNNQPGKKTDYGITTVAPGNSYTIASFPCPAGQAIGFEMSDCGNTNFRYFQDYNPSPIGLYITKC
ncbi:GPI anchored cell wall protein, partial [Metarhizium majus ARSEF 297]